MKKIQVKNLLVFKMADPEGQSNCVHNDFKCWEKLVAISLEADKIGNHIAYPVFHALVFDIKHRKIHFDKNHFIKYLHSEELDQCLDSLVANNQLRLSTGESGEHIYSPGQEVIKNKEAYIKSWEESTGVPFKELCGWIGEQLKDPEAIFKKIETFYNKQKEKIFCYSFGPLLTFKVGEHLVNYLFSSDLDSDLGFLYSVGYLKIGVTQKDGIFAYIPGQKAKRESNYFLDGFKKSIENSGLARYEDFSDFVKNIVNGKNLTGLLLNCNEIYPQVI
jgi:hypothetical protein